LEVVIRSCQEGGPL